MERTYNHNSRVTRSSNSSTTANHSISKTRKRRTSRRRKSLTIIFEFRHPYRPTIEKIAKIKFIFLHSTGSKTENVSAQDGQQRKNGFKNKMILPALPRTTSHSSYFPAQSSFVGQYTSNISLVPSSLNCSSMITLRSRGLELPSPSLLVYFQESPTDLVEFPFPIAMSHMPFQLNLQVQVLLPINIRIVVLQITFLFFITHTYLNVLLEIKIIKWKQQIIMIFINILQAFYVVRFIEFPI